MMTANIQSTHPNLPNTATLQESLDVRQQQAAYTEVKGTHSIGMISLCWYSRSQQHL